MITKRNSTKTIGFYELIQYFFENLERKERLFMKDDLFSTNVEREIGVIEDFFDEELDDMYQWLQYMDGKK